MPLRLNLVVYGSADVLEVPEQMRRSKMMLLAKHASHSSLVVVFSQAMAIRFSFLLDASAPSPYQYCHCFLSAFAYLS